MDYIAKRVADDKRRREQIRTERQRRERPDNDGILQKASKPLSLSPGLHASAEPRDAHGQLDENSAISDACAFIPAYEREWGERNRPQAMMVFGMASRSLEAGKTAFALRDLTSAIKCDPSFLEARVKRAELTEAAMDFLGAARDWKCAIEADPTNGEWVCSLSNCLYAACLFDAGHRVLVERVWRDSRCSNEKKKQWNLEDAHRHIQVIVERLFSAANAVFDAPSHEDPPAIVVFSSLRCDKMNI